IFHCKEQPENNGTQPERFLQPQVGEARPADRARWAPVAALARTTKTARRPGVAGIVLMNTPSWKILVTRVNRKMRCRGSAPLAYQPMSGELVRRASPLGASVGALAR